MAMVTWLKQSTARTVTIGPFVDSTDGVTAETALTLSQADIRLSKNDGAFGQKNQSSTATHKENGYYSCSLDTTDTDTLGNLTLGVNESGALPVRHDFLVVPSNIWDSFVGNTNILNTNVYSIAGLTTLRDLFAASLAGIVTGTSDNTGFTATNSIMETTITEATADHYNGRVIVFTSGSLLGQATLITDYALNGGRGRFTMSTLTEVVPNGTTFVIV